MALSARQILDVAIAAGFPPGDDAIMATAIALAESRGVPTAYNGEVFKRGDPIPARLQSIMGTVCKQDWCGDLSYGLWQINMRPDYGAQRRQMWGLSNNEQLFDPATNARAAYDLYRRRGGRFTDWSTYTYSNYRAFMPAAQAAFAQYSPPVAAPPNPSTGPAPIPAAAGSTSAPVPSLEVKPTEPSTSSAPPSPKSPSMPAWLSWLFSFFRGTK